MWEAVIIFFVGLILLITLIAQKTTETIPNDFFWTVYVVLGILTMMGLSLSIVFTLFDVIRSSSAETYTAGSLSASQPSPFALFDITLLRWGAVLALLVLTVGSIAGFGSLVPVPTPLGQGLSQVDPLSLEGSGTFLNIWNLSAYPGFFEEGAMFLFTLIISSFVAAVLAFIFLGSIAKFRDWRVFLPAALVGSSASSLLFTAMHKTAYGLDGLAYLKAFVFEFIMQFSNMILGGFYSWIHHFAHNGIIGFELQVAFAIGAAAFLFWKVKSPISSKGQYAVASAVASIIFVALVGAFLFIAYAAGSGAGLFSVSNFGEEGFKPYDPNLELGVISPQKWNGPVEYVSVVNGDFHVERPLRDSGSYQTENLFLTDFRYDWSAQTDGGSNEQTCVQLRVIADGETVYSRSLTSVNCGSPRDELGKTGSFSLAWSNLADGEFQIFDTSSGVPEGTWNAKESVVVAWYLGRQNAASDWTHQLQIKNPRIKRVLGCDVQEGETIVPACVSGPMFLTRDELPGWKEGESRFCIDLGATQLNGAAGDSNRIYYELAGDGYALEAGEAWSIQYINPSGPDDKVSIGGACDVQSVDDSVDYESNVFSDGPRSLIWDAAYEGVRRPVLLSGSKVLLEAQTPEYLCSDSDGHDPSGDSIFYPLPDASCWRFLIDDIVVDGKTLFGPLSVDLVDAQARVRYGEGYGEGTVPRDEWTARYDLSIAQDFLTVTKVSRVDDTLLVTVKNDYKPLTAVVGVSQDAQVINEPTITSSEIVLEVGHTIVSVSLEQGFTGAQEYEIVPLLKTEAGLLQAGQIAEVTFSDEEDMSAEVSEKGLFARWWSAIKNWWGVIFG